jgi:hypothetical protein
MHPSKYKRSRPALRAFFPIAASANPNLRGVMLGDAHGRRADSQHRAWIRVWGPRLVTPSDAGIFPQSGMLQGCVAIPKKHFFVMVPGCRVAASALDMGFTVSQRDIACLFGDVRLKGVS